MHFGDALRATHHAVHTDGKNIIHVIEVPTAVARLFAGSELFEYLNPDHDIVLLVTRGPGKPWMPRSKMPEGFLSHYGIRLDDVLAVTAHDNSGSGFPQTLYSRGLLDDGWKSGQESR